VTSNSNEGCGRFEIHKYMAVTIF